ncbi:MAG: hypothetical protein AB8F78_09805 [Saprospiraceae bacterium]
MNRIYYLLFTITALILLTASSCDQDPLTTTPEELAEQIRRNTPTELPPITTSGENTMGAWIHPQPGSPLHDLEGDSILFVASGVDRPETALATSLDCAAFNNLLQESSGWISVQGRYCRRPEIDDDRQISLNFGLVTPDSVELKLIYTQFSGDRGLNYWTRGFSNSQLEYEVSNDNRSENILSGTFSGQLINRALPYDTILVDNGRFDVTYGTTP